jgi:hypothetical protein
MYRGVLTGLMESSIPFRCHMKKGMHLKFEVEWSIPIVYSPQCIPRTRVVISGN